MITDKGLKVLQGLQNIYSSLQYSPEREKNSDLIFDSFDKLITLFYPKVISL